MIGKIAEWFPVAFSTVLDFRVVHLLNWLPHKFKDFSRLYYLTYSYEEISGFVSFKWIVKAENLVGSSTLSTEFTFCVHKHYTIHK